MWGIAEEIGISGWGGCSLQLGPMLDAAEKPGGSENAGCSEEGWRKVNMRVCCVAPGGMAFLMQE